MQGDIIITQQFVDDIIDQYDASPTASKGRLRILFTTARIRARERSNSFSQVCTRRRYSLSFSIRVCFSCHSFSASLSTGGRASSGADSSTLGGKGWLSLNPGLRKRAGCQDA